MTVLMIVFCILMVACGFTCMFTPLLTFMDTGYFIVILVAVYGVIGIIRAIRAKHFGVNFVFSILSILFGIAVLVFPQLMLFADGVLIYMTAAWFVLQGIVNIMMSVTLTKATGSKIWILQLIIGIIGIMLGCYSFFHPAVLALSLGFLVGFYFMETGFALIFGSFSDN